MNKRLNLRNTTSTSSLFLLPMLELNRSFIESHFATNVFHSDYFKPNLNNNILILYNPRNKKEFSEFINLLMTLPEYVENYPLNDDYHIVVFKTPKIYNEDYKTFLTGQYSKISDKLKRKILKYFDKGIESDLYGVLYKTEAKRRSLSHQLSHTRDGYPVLPVEIKETEEYLDILYPEKEVLRYNSLGARLHRHIVN